MAYNSLRLFGAYFINAPERTTRHVVALGVYLLRA